MKKYFASSELIINEDGSVFHLHVKPEWLADKIILVGDPGRVALVASHFENKECEVESREFKTITGTYKGKRITVVSTGIGCDNIDIVMNELDALANIDFQTREEKKQLRQLELVRIGTCGGLQPYTPVGTFVCSAKSIGFDGLLNFYAGRNSVCDLPFERAFLNHMGWSGNMCAPAPYVIDANAELIDRIAGPGEAFAHDEIGHAAAHVAVLVLAQIEQGAPERRGVPHQGADEAEAARIVAFGDAERDVVAACRVG